MAVRLLFTDMEDTLFEKQHVQLRSGEPHHHHSLWSRLMAALGPAALEGRVDFVRLLMREYGLRREECAFIGDGQNDVFIAGEVGLSFACQAHPELRAAATHELEDFTDLQQWI